MKKLLVYIAVLVLLSPDVYSQTKDIKLKGNLIDSDSESPLEFATVSIFDQEDNLVTGTISDFEGKFTIPITEGTYTIKIQFVGYKETVLANQTITSSTDIYDIGILRIAPDVEQLSEVVIEAKKVEMEIELDKRVFNVMENLSNTGRNASEILDNLPSVNVDLEGNVSLRGSSNVRILVDGKPSGLVGIDNTDGLRTLNGNLIEKVEVITNPSARYDAQGQAGIINIVLKKEKAPGLNGAANINVGVPQDYGAGLSFNFRKDKLNFFINYGLNYRKTPGQGRSYQEFNLPDTSFVTERTRDHRRGGLSNNIRFGSDFIIDDKNTLTASALFRGGLENNNTEIVYRDFDQNGDLINNILRTDNEAEDELNQEYELSYRREFDQEGMELTALVQYRDNGEIEDSDLQELNNDGDPILDQRALNDEGERQWLMQADFVLPLSEDAKFEAGYRGTLRDIKNDYLVEELNENGDWVSLPGFTNDFRYEEDIHAAYVIAGNKTGRWSYQGGLRAESTYITTFLTQTGEFNEKSYINLFPSMFLNYELKEGQTLQASYSRRINRPRFRSLNPFSSFSDARNIRIGNPDLDPELTDSYELGYLTTYNTGNVYLGGYYRYTIDVIQRVTFVGDDGITYSQPQNLSTEDSYGLELTASQDITKDLSFNGNLNFFRAITNGIANGEDLSADTYSWSGRITSILKLPGLFEAQLTGFYRGPQNVPQGIRKSIYSIDLGVSKDVLNNNGTLSLSVRDLFNTRKYRGISQGETFYQESEFQWRTRQATLTFTYRLNQQKSRKGGGDRGFGGDEGF